MLAQLASGGRAMDLVIAGYCMYLVHRECRGRNRMSKNLS